MFPGNIEVTMQEKVQRENKRHEPTPRHWKEEWAVITKYYQAITLDSVILDNTLYYLLILGNTQATALDSGIT